MENMFESWLEQEKTGIREKSRRFRIMSILLVILMIPFILSMLVLLLDGGGIMTAIVLILQVVCLVIAVFFLSYKRRLIKPLLVSVEKDLPTDTERQEFARQMQSAMVLGYAPVPQGQLCEMQAAADHCYFRQPFKSRIIRNRDIKKAVLERDRYFVGRGHVRYCYALNIFLAENEKTPVWRAYFPTEDELYAIVSRLRGVLPEETAICDNVAYGKTEEGEKENRKQALIELIKAIVMLAILIALAKLL